MYLICHVILQDHVIKGFCDFNKGSSSLYRTTLSSHCCSGDIAYFICQVILQERHQKVSEFMERSSSLNVATLPGLMAINIAVVDFDFITWPHGTMYSKGCLTLMVEASHSKSPPCQVWWPQALL